MKIKTKRKIIKEYEDKIEMMSMHLDSWIETIQHERDFNDKLLDVKNPETKEYASRNVRQCSEMLMILRSLRRNFNVIFDQPNN